MKNWLPHSILFAVLLLFASQAQAQDAGMSDVEIVDEPGTADKIVYAPGEDVRYVPEADGVVKVKDSVFLQIQDFPMQQATMKPPQATSAGPAEKPKDDSILTFNFLYYIIQKYKLQDIID